MKFRDQILASIPHFEPMRPGYYLLASERAKTMASVDWWEAWERRVVHQYNQEHPDDNAVASGHDWAGVGDWWSDNFSTILILALLHD